MAIHDNFVALATRLIQKNGRPVSVRRNVGTTEVEAGKPWRGTVENFEDSPTTAVFLDEDERDKLLLIPGAPDQRTQMPQQTKTALIPAAGLSFEIEIGHKLVDGSKVWEIRQVNPIKPGPTLVMFAVEVIL